MPKRSTEESALSSCPRWRKCSVPFRENRKAPCRALQNEIGVETLMQIVRRDIESRRSLGRQFFRPCALTGRGSQTLLFSHWQECLCFCQPIEGGCSFCDVMRPQNTASKSKLGTATILSQKERADAFCKRQLPAFTPLVAFVGPPFTQTSGPLFLEARVHHTLNPCRFAAI